MSTVDKVGLHELDAIASLVGETNNSEVVDVTGRLVLRGAFALRLHGATSKFTDFSTLNAEVVRDGGGFALRSVARCVFTFDSLFVEQPHAAGPWLAASRASLRLAAGGAVLLSLDDASVSIVPDIPFTPGQRFHFPNQLGPSSAALSPASSGGGAVFGNFIQRHADGTHAVRFGGLGTSIVIDPHLTSAVLMPTDVGIEFRLDEFPASRSATLDHDVVPQPLTLRDAGSLTGMRVRAEAASGARLSHVLGNISFVRCETVQIGEGWMSAVEMHATEKDVLVGRRHAAAASTGDTMLLARPTRVRYHMPLAQRNGTMIHNKAPHFAYRDERLSDPQAVLKPRDRHHGLRIRGLHSDRGGPAKLDANWATVSLESGEAHFRAGGTLRVRGTDVASVALPKTDPAQPTRRTLVVPAGLGQLRCDVDAIPDFSADSPIRFDTSAVEDQRLHLRVALDVPPAGSPGVDAAASASSAKPFARWSLLPKSEPTFRLRVNDRGVFPGRGEGWPSDFMGSSGKFALLEYPGSGITLNPPLEAIAGPNVRAEVVTTTLTTTRVDASPKEILVYSAISALIAVKDKLVEWAAKINEAFVDETAVPMVLQDLDSATMQQLVKQREVDNLVVVFFDGAVSGVGDAEAKKFVDRNRKADTTRVVWPFAPSVAALLWDKTMGYGVDIARAKGKRPGTAFDLSSSRSIEFGDFGWTAADRTRFIAEPLLWPRLSGRSGAQLDPTDATWRGVLLREQPMVLDFRLDGTMPVPPFARTFYDMLNEHLMLDYGWKDETGTTWNGGFEDLSGISIVPAGWRSVLDLQIIRFTTRGSSGRIIGTDGEFRVVLPAIKRKNTNDPFTFTGKFALNLAVGLKLDRLEFAPENVTDIETASVPGFDKVQLVRFSTDLRTMQMTLRLVPSAALAQVLPFLGNGQSIDVTSQVVLDGSSAPPSWSFALRSEIQTNLFGRWPLTVQSLELTFGATNTLIMRVRLNLGLPSFASVAAKLILKETSGSWTLDIELQEISGSIRLGDFSLSGSLAWSSVIGDTASVPASTITTGRQRDFWGEVTLDTGGLVDGTLLLRIGNVGELSYWVGALRLDEINFGPAAKLKDPALLLAHHVDFAQTGGLAKAIADPTTSIAEIVRAPKGGLNRTWLANWVPSENVGTIVAGSGFLNIHDVVAAAPDNPGADDFTALLVSDSGLFRAEATLMLFKTARSRVGLAVDLNRKQFAASIQIPEFKYGSFTVRAGEIAFGLGWGEPYFLLSVGWPEAINGEVMNRDWSKSVMIHWDGAFPLNTFWGGSRAILDTNALVLGFAFRGGWTWDYSVSVGGVAKGSASLGVAIGGTVEVYFGRNNPAPRLLSPSDVRALPPATAVSAREAVDAFADAYELDEDTLAAMQFAAECVDSVVARLDVENITARVVYYADVWGKASAEIFGVTLFAIDVGAHAAFVGCIQFMPDLEIVRLSARVGLHLSVRIGCFTYSAQASIDITIRDLGRPCFPSGARAPQALSAETRKALA
jgi:hypothetical protein